MIFDGFLDFGGFVEFLLNLFVRASMMLFNAFFLAGQKILIIALLEYIVNILKEEVLDESDYRKFIGIGENGS